jgi:hypothetical protein
MLSRRHDGERIRFNENVVGPILCLSFGSIARGYVVTWPAVDPDDQMLDPRGNRSVSQLEMGHTFCITQPTAVKRTKSIDNDTLTPRNPTGQSMF